ncbi:dolichyl-phosphate-mannose--protein mannosyltransferase [Anaeramoeba ignava]|uniref:Dolichyl-phosphate-mannose--protein mannosyltransferase n=1 Tax=Anaeramoeba ignava TaxID=1746090 RepID=A0A9Q0LYY2_ANAIG|nr:dolichyl-phosphate-mannose--protein mannosyltransferase [Anaeramoeba ignava]
MTENKKALKVTFASENENEIDLNQIASFNLKKTQKSHRKFNQIGKKTETIILFISLAISFTTRFWKLSHPKETLLPEISTGKSINHYLLGEFFAGQKPPFANMLMSFVAKICATKPALTFTSPGEQIPPDFPLTCLRTASTFFGSLVPELVYLVTRSMGGSVIASFLAASMIIFENTMIVQSHLISTNSFVLLLVISAVFFALKETHLRPLSKKSLFAMSLSAVSLGMAISSEPFSWVTFIFIILFQIINIFRQKNQKKIIIFKRILSIFVIFFAFAIVIFIISYNFHFNFLPFNENDNLEQKTMLYSDGLIQSADSKQAGFGFLPDFLSQIHSQENIIDESAEIYSNEMKVQNYASNWHQWLLHTSKAVELWRKDSTDITEPKQYIYSIGNPFVWWIVFFCVIFIIFNFLMINENTNTTENKNKNKNENENENTTENENENENKNLKRKNSVSHLIYTRYDYLLDMISTNSFNLFFLLCGYFIHLLPIFRKDKFLFNYDYQYSLLFGIILASLVIDFILSTLTSDQVFEMIIACTIWVIVIFGWFFFIPIIYGYDIDVYAFQKRFWFKSWR